MLKDHAFNWSDDEDEEADLGHPVNTKPSPPLAKKKYRDYEALSQ